MLLGTACWYSLIFSVDGERAQQARDPRVLAGRPFNAARRQFARERQSPVIRLPRSIWPKPSVPIHDSARRCRFFL